MVTEMTEGGRHSARQLGASDMQARIGEMLSSYPLRLHERNRLVALSYVVEGRDWEAAFFGRCSPRTIERLKVEYSKRGLAAAFHSRRDRTPPVYQAAKEVVRAGIAGGGRRLPSAHLKKCFANEGIPAPSARTLRRPCCAPGSSGSATCGADLRPTYRASETPILPKAPGDAAAMSISARH